MKRVKFFLSYFVQLLCEKCSTHFAFDEQCREVFYWPCQVLVSVVTAPKNSEVRILMLLCRILMSLKYTLIYNLLIHDERFVYVVYEVTSHESYYIFAEHPRCDNDTICMPYFVYIFKLLHCKLLWCFFLCYRFTCNNMNLVNKYV